MINTTLRSKTPATPAGTALGFRPQVCRDEHGYRVTVTHREPMMWSDGMYTTLMLSTVFDSQAQAECFIRLRLVPAGRADAERGLVLPKLDLRFWSEPSEGAAAVRYITTAECARLDDAQAAFEDRLNR